MRSASEYRAAALRRLYDNIIPNGTGCTSWRGPRANNGYIQFSYEGKTQLAHRVLWTLIYGPIPDGLIVRHTCDNRECLLLSHLTLGTPKENSQDAVARNRGIGRPRKIDEATKKVINALRAEGRTVADIAAYCGVTTTCIYGCLNPEFKRAKPAVPDLDDL